jgi:F0F1-type ATP synthase membrane subunit b/b'
VLGRLNDDEATILGLGQPGRFIRRCVGDLCGAADPVVAVGTGGAVDTGCFMALTQVFDQFKTLSGAAKLGIAAGVVVLLLVGHYISGRWNLFHDTRFDTKIQEKLQQADQLGGQVEQMTKQIEDLTKEHDAANKRAEASEKREQDLIQETLLYKAAAEAGSKREAAAVDKLADEDKRYVEETEQQSGVVMSACDRWIANCKRAVKIIKGFKGPCNCDQIPAR